MRESTQLLLYEFNSVFLCAPLSLVSIFEDFL